MKIVRRRMKRLGLHPATPARGTRRRPAARERHRHGTGRGRVGRVLDA